MSMPRDDRLFSRLSATLGLALLSLAACSKGAAPAEVPARSEAERLALPPDLASGQALFRECAVCHERDATRGHRVGPNLAGIVGAPAGRHADFAYSGALKRSQIIWTEATLDAYVTAPQSVIPGGRMAYQGMPGAADRRDVIAFLATQTAAP